MLGQAGPAHAGENDLLLGVDVGDGPAQATFEHVRGWGVGTPRAVVQDDLLNPEGFRHAPFSEPGRTLFVKGVWLCFPVGATHHPRAGAAGCTLYVKTG